MHSLETIIDEYDGKREEMVAAEVIEFRARRAKQVPRDLRKSPIIKNQLLPLAMLNPADWQGQSIPSRDWYVDELIPARQVTILSGDGGVGKSLLALQICAASAMGCDVLGLRPSPGRVLYLGAEDEADEFHRRLADIVSGYRRTLGELSNFRLVPMAGESALLSVPDRAGIMQPTDLWTRFVAAAQDFRPVVVVLDTVADLFGGDEIKRGQARQFIGMLRKFAIDIDCAVVLLAHPSQQGMESGTGKSGSTGWANSARSMLYMTRPSSRDEDPDCRILSTKKANYSRLGDDIRLRWRDGYFVADDGMASPAAGLLAKRAEAKFVDLLRDISRTGRNLSPNKSSSYAPKVMADHPIAEGVSRKQFEQAMATLLHEGVIKVMSEGPPSKRRDRLVVSDDD